MSQNLDLLMAEAKEECAIKYANEMERAANEWKRVALEIREQYGKAMGLLGEAYNYLAVVAYYQAKGVGIPASVYVEWADLEKRITAYTATAQVQQ